MLVLIDNYDSFTYNIVHAFYEIDLEVKVVQGATTTVSQIMALNPSYLVLGPGPGSPLTLNTVFHVIEYFKGKIPILGICLGHQAIGLAFGAKVVRAKAPMHGKISDMTHDGSALFKGIPNPFQAVRYHSLIVEDLPDELIVIGESEGEVMALRHRFFPIFGVQFHPESILSQYGSRLLTNFTH